MAQADVLKRMGETDKSVGSIRQDVESAADAILLESGDGVKIYSERALERKMRIEAKRMPDMEETSLPHVVIDYLLHSQIELLMGSAVLTRFQAAVLELAIQGWQPAQIADDFHIPLHIVKRTLSIARRKVSQRRSCYDGLYQVYWQEVHRCIYRKHRGKEKEK